MLELLVILAVMVFIVSKLDARHFEQAKTQWGLGSGSPGAVAPGGETPRPRPRLAIDGTQRPGIANFKFVKGFGVNPQQVADLRTFSHFGRFEQFPAAIRSLIAELHEAGCAVGPTIMEMLFHGRGLQEGEAVYFALVEGRQEPHVVAFVDQLRLK
jgi:hypothetical protein